VAIDATKLGQVSAALMEYLDDNVEDGAELGEVLILAEVRGVDDDGSFTYIQWRCSDERDWVQRGMLHAALDSDRVPDLGDDDGEPG
jgi:hypothetical protein